VTLRDLTAVIGTRSEADYGGPSRVTVHQTGMGM